MTYTLTQEEQKVLSDIKSDLIILQRSILHWFLLFFKYSWTTSKLFVFSLEEFSLKNIRTHGVGEILYQRALRFFGLNDEEASAKKQQSTQKNKRSTYPVKCTSFKVAIRLIVLGAIRGSKRRDSRKKRGKNVYIEKFT